MGRHFVSAAAALCLACGPSEADTDGSSASNSGAGGISGSGGEPEPICGAVGIQLTDVVAGFPTNVVLGDEVDAEYDETQGSFACYQAVDDDIRIKVVLGPFAEPEPRSLLLIEIRDGVRSYDLGTDAGAPATGDFGLVGLSYAYSSEPATTISFDTKNSAFSGTLDVVALPTAEAPTLEISATGQQPDSWIFDLLISARLPAE